MSDGMALAVGGVVGAVLALGIGTVFHRRRLEDAHQALERTTAAHEAKERADAERAGLQEGILDAMEEGVLLVRADGPPLFSNLALAVHLGNVPGSAEAIRPLELARCVQDALGDRERHRAEVEIGAPTRWLRATALPVDDDAVLLVVRDVTQARRLSAMRTDFVANASHELKTPVASIRAAAETLRAGAIEDPPAAQRFTEQLERESIRLSRIIADLLDLSRLESGPEGDELVQLDTIAADETDRFGGTAHERGVELGLVTRQVPPVRGSSRDLSLLAANLIDNAIRYTQAGGSVTVEVERADDDVLLRVRDTGVGIPQRDLPRIFERFYRVDQARSRETGGTGLGLSIVKHVCENHGGTIAVTSELGQGTTFEVRLPVVAGTTP